MYTYTITVHIWKHRTRTLSGCSKLCEILLGLPFLMSSLVCECSLNLPPLTSTMTSHFLLMLVGVPTPTPAHSQHSLLSLSFRWLLTANRLKQTRIRWDGTMITQSRQISGHFDKGAYNSCDQFRTFISTLESTSWLLMQLIWWLGNITQLNSQLGFYTNWICNLSSRSSNDEIKLKRLQTKEKVC